MKSFGYGLTLLLLTLIATTAAAQTITTGPLDRTIYCADDSITVDYTVTGSFAPGNVFLLQMSDTSDDFTERFFNLGTVTSTSSGSIRAKLPPAEDERLHRPLDRSRFRFRVVASNPVVLGSDNGTDIELIAQPPVQGSPARYAVVGNPANFTAYLHRATGHSWDFGPGATPQIVNKSGDSGVQHTVTTFDSPGKKQVVVNATSEGGCSNWQSFDVEVLSPNVTIPSTAIIVQGEVTGADHRMPRTDYWVCPGSKLTIKDDHSNREENDIVIYAEFGSAVVVEHTFLNKLTIYARSGAAVSSVEIERYTLIMYEEGASVPQGRSNGDAHLKVTALTFDYSNVPPNGCPSLAPYTVEIKPSSNGIHTESNENGSDDHYRVYGDGDLRISGDRNTYYLDEGSALELRGSDSRIYAKNGATVNVVEGSNNRIFYELQATLEATGDAAILLPSSGITFVGDISGVNESGAANSALVRVVPNPARDDVRINVDPALGRVVSIEIYVLATGERLMRVDEASAATSLDLRGLPSGLYGVRVIAEKGEVVKTLRVEAGE